MLVMKNSLLLFHISKDGNQSVMLFKGPFFTTNALLHGENICLVSRLFESRIRKHKNNCVDRNVLFTCQDSSQRLSYAALIGFQNN